MSTWIATWNLRKRRTDLGWSTKIPADQFGGEQLPVVRD